MYQTLKTSRNYREVPGKRYETFGLSTKLSVVWYQNDGTIFQSTKPTMALSAYYETLGRFTKLWKVRYMMYETINHFTELTNSSVAKWPNPVKSAEFKKIQKESHESICNPRSLKKFSAKMRNL